MYKRWLQNPSNRNTLVSRCVQGTDSTTLRQGIEKMASSQLIFFVNGIKNEFPANLNVFSCFFSSFVDGFLLFFARTKT
ncbi:hypothetical protein CHS0354_016552 [Potamilus streckersoni]|uniref:Uncharacterized protein n=1 Tax=Potamilus streckersoni TaxID=2493646 RepID=A0AAE0WGU6_9BIVA|nr:hypothetical protein CHS0354_016552 [Potamilus streckersoni]